MSDFSNSTICSLNRAFSASSRDDDVAWVVLSGVGSTDKYFDKFSKTEGKALGFKYRRSRVAEDLLRRAFESSLEVL